jgi:hypothetical protein
MVKIADMNKTAPTEPISIGEVRHAFSEPTVLLLHQTAVEKMASVHQTASL